jgi:hypothetical protein
MPTGVHKQRRLDSQRPVAGPPLPDVAGRAPEVRLRKDLAVFIEFFRLSAFVSHTHSRNLDVTRPFAVHLNKRPPKGWVT